MFEEVKALCNVSTSMPLLLLLAKCNLLSLHVLKMMLLKLWSLDGDLRNVYHPAMGQSTNTEREYLGKNVTL